jgi:cytochrome c553
MNVLTIWIQRWVINGSMAFFMTFLPVDRLMADSPGENLYQKTCKKCHGKLGEGKESRSEPGKFKYPPIKQLGTTELSTIISRYRAMQQDKLASKMEMKMAKAVRKLSDGDIEALVQFITAEPGL